MLRAEQLAESPLKSKLLAEPAHPFFVTAEDVINTYEENRFTKRVYALFYDEHLEVIENLRSKLKARTLGYWEVGRTLKELGSGVPIDIFSYWVHGGRPKIEFELLEPLRKLEVFPHKPTPFEYYVLGALRDGHLGNSYTRITGNYAYLEDLIEKFNELPGLNLDKPKEFATTFRIDIPLYARIFSVLGGPKGKKLETEYDIPFALCDTTISDAYFYSYLAGIVDTAEKPSTGVKNAGSFKIFQGKRDTLEANLDAYMNHLKLLLEHHKIDCKFNPDVKIMQKYEEKTSITKAITFTRKQFLGLYHKIRPHMLNREMVANYDSAMRACKRAPNIEDNLKQRDLFIITYIYAHANDNGDAKISSKELARAIKICPGTVRYHLRTRMNDIVEIVGTGSAPIYRLKSYGLLKEGIINGKSINRICAEQGILAQ